MSFRDDLNREFRAAGEIVVPPTVDVDKMRLKFGSFAAEDAPKDMIAVDGSYSFLLNLSSWWLASISVGLLHYSFSGDRFRKVDWRMVQRVVGVSTYEDYVQSQNEFYRTLYDFTRGSKEQHREMVNEWRRFVEGQLAVKMAEESRDCVIAIDGALAAFPKQFDFVGRLAKICEENGHVLVGVSKDSQLHAFGSALNDEDLLRKAESTQDGDSPLFVRVPEEFERRQRALLHGDVYYCKFHPRSRKWFRVDLGTMRDRPGVAFSHVAPYCRSLLAVGYPLPLIEAHRMAVTVRQLKSVHQEAVIKHALRLGMHPMDVLDGLTEIEGRKRSAFHEYLDRLSRDRR